MKRDAAAGWRWSMSISCMWVMLGCLVLVSHFGGTTKTARNRPGDNPNKFHLWATDAGFTYTFTYDPHAADVWLFQSGGSRAVSPVAAQAGFDSNTQGLRMLSFPSGR